MLDSLGWNTSSLWRIITIKVTRSGHFLFTTITSGKLPYIKSLLFFVLTLQIYGVAVVTHAHMIPLNNQALQLPTVVLLLLVQTLFYLLVILLWPSFSKHKSAIVFSGQVKQIHLHPVFSGYQEYSS